MFPSLMSNSTSFSQQTTLFSTILNSSQNPQISKKKRSLPGNPDPDAEVVALSPKTLLATNRFVCEICNKGFQRDQNLQLHKRGHNIPWKLKQRNNKDVIRKRAYVCPEPSCVHHNPSRALGDLTGIKKHYSRKHCEKKWKCDKCSKIYAVYSDWKAHSKICGTREYKCHCGTLFSRKDRLITHRAFCDALAEESARMFQIFPTQQNPNTWDPPQQNPNNMKPHVLAHDESENLFDNINLSSFLHNPKNNTLPLSSSHIHVSATSAHLSATALLQKAATVGATHISMPEFGSVDTRLNSVAECHHHCFVNNMTRLTTTGKNNEDNGGLTRDFLGLTNGGSVHVSMDVNDILTFTEGVEFQSHQQGGFAFFGTTTETVLSESWENC